MMMMKIPLFLLLIAFASADSATPTASPTPSPTPRLRKQCPAGTWKPTSGSCTGTPCVSGDGPKGATSPDQAFCVESCSFMQWRDIESCSSLDIHPKNCTCSMRIEGSVVFWTNVSAVIVVLFCHKSEYKWLLWFFTLLSLGGTYLKVASLSTWEQLSPFVIAVASIVPSCYFVYLAILACQKLIKWCNTTTPSSLTMRNMRNIV